MPHAAAAGARSASAIPEASPPPPIGTAPCSPPAPARRARARSCPGPRSPRSSSNGWTNVAPRLVGVRARRGERVLEASRRPSRLARRSRGTPRPSPSARPAARRSSPGCPPRAPPTRPPGRGCPRSPRRRRPRARSSVSVATLLTAPRTLNEPVRWRFSAFSTTSRPVEPRERLRRVDRRHRARSRRAARAPPRCQRVSGRAVAIAVLLANVEHLLHDLANGRQRVELAALHLVEQPPQLGVAGDRLLEMRLRACRGDREDLARRGSRGAARSS